MTDMLCVVAIQMGRPSKHRLQTTASLRQRDMKQLVKLGEDSDEDGWHGQQTAGHLHSRLSNMSADGLAGKPSADDGLMMTSDGMIVKKEQSEEMTMFTQRSRSFGSDANLSVINSDSNSSFNELSPDRPSALPSCDARSCNVAGVSVKMEHTDVVTQDARTSRCVNAANKQFTVSWPGRCPPAAESSKQQHVLSGGYCCEVKAGVVSSPMPFVADNFCSSPTYVVSKSMPLAATAVPASRHDSAMTLEDSKVPVTCNAVYNVSTTSVESPDAGITATAMQSQATDRTRMTDIAQVMDVSPGSKWHLANDRDSPYVSVMALASSCHLFSESCPTNSADDDENAHIYDQMSSRYWLEPDLPDENVIFTEKHCEMINQITAAYDRYVQTGTIINETLVTEMKVTPTANTTVAHCMRFTTCVSQSFSVTPILGRPSILGR